jgi:hypothetical protein
MMVFSCKHNGVHVVAENSFVLGKTGGYLCQVIEAKKSTGEKYKEKKNEHYYFMSCQIFLHRKSMTGTGGEDNCI